MGTVAKRYMLELELREQARRLLDLDAGSLATGPTSMVDLETTLDYLTTLVQDGSR